MSSSTSTDHRWAHTADENTSCLIYEQLSQWSDLDFQHLDDLDDLKDFFKDNIRELREVLDKANKNEQYMDTDTRETTHPHEEVDATLLVQQNAIIDEKMYEIRVKLAELQRFLCIQEHFKGWDQSLRSIEPAMWDSPEMAKAMTMFNHYRDLLPEAHAKTSKLLSELCKMVKDYFATFLKFLKDHLMTNEDIRPLVRGSHHVNVERERSATHGTDGVEGVRGQQIDTNINPHAQDDYTGPRGFGKKRARVDI